MCGEGNGDPLQCSCLENSTDRGAWRATVHGVAKSQTRLSAHACTHTHTHMDIVDKIHCTGWIAARLNYVRSPRPDLRLTLPLMAWPGSQGPNQLPQVSAVPYIRPPGLITPLGFCDQPLSPHTGAPGVSASSPNPPCIHSCGCRQSRRIHCPREPRVSREWKQPGRQRDAPESLGCGDMPQLLVTMATTKQGLSQGSLGIWGGQEPPPYPFIQHLLPCQEREPVSPPWMANLQVHPTGAKSMREHVFFSRTSLCVDVVLFFFLSLSSPN